MTLLLRRLTDEVIDVADPNKLRFLPKLDAVESPLV